MFTGAMMTLIAVFGFAGWFVVAVKIGKPRQSGDLIDWVTPTLHVVNALAWAGVVAIAELAYLLLQTIGIIW